MRFDLYEISLWDFAVCCMLCVWLWVKFAFFSYHYEIFPVSLLNFRLKFPYEVVCFLLRNFLTRFPDEISCFLATVRSPYEMCCVSLHTFLMQFPQEISCFLAVVRCPCEILCFLLRNFRTRFPDEISCFFGPLRALCMRLHACWALMRFLVWFMSPTCITWSWYVCLRMALTTHEHVLVIQGRSLGVWVGGVIYVIWWMLAFFSWALTLNVICLLFLPTVFVYSKVSTSSICGYSWHQSKVSNKPSPLSTNLCWCPAGTYCPSGPLASSTPLVCTAGSYCTKGSTATAPCPSGHFCPSASSLVLCPAGVVKWDPGWALGWGWGTG